MRIVILGANGQIGRSIYAALDRTLPQAEIIAAVRRPHLHFEGCTGDRQHRSIVFDPFADDWTPLGRVDVLINCIGAIRETKRMSFRRVHAGLAQEILEHRKAIGFPRIIQLSALGAELDSASAFLRAKAEADALLLREENTYVLRPSIVCTPGTMLVRKLRALRKISRFCFGKIFLPEKFLQTKIQPLAAEDLGELVRKMIDAAPPQRTLCAAGPHAFTLRELIALSLPAVQVKAIPQKLFDRFYAIFGFLLRPLLSREQDVLLRKDNVSCSPAAGKWLGRPLRSTEAFWRHELSAQAEKAQQLQWHFA